MTPRALTDLVAKATRAVSLEQFRKTEEFAHLWLCYTRMLARMGTSDDDVRDTYKFMKSEGIGQRSKFFFSARAEFERSVGNTAKCRDILKAGSRCPAASEAAEVYEERFQKMLEALDDATSVTQVTTIHRVAIEASTEPTPDSATSSAAATGGADVTEDITVVTIKTHTGSSAAGAIAADIDTDVMATPTAKIATGVSRTGTSSAARNSKRLLTPASSTRGRGAPASSATRRANGAQRSTFKRPSGNIGMPLRVTAASLAAATEELESPGPAAAAAAARSDVVAFGSVPAETAPSSVRRSRGSSREQPSEDTTQVFFGAVSDREMRGKGKMAVCEQDNTVVSMPASSAANTAVISVAATAKGHSDSSPLIRRRDEAKPSGARPSAEAKKQRTAARRGDDVAVDGFAGFKTPQLKSRRGDVSADSTATIRASAQDAFSTPRVQSRMAASTSTVRQAARSAAVSSAVTYSSQTPTPRGSSAKASAGGEVVMVAGKPYTKLGKIGKGGTSNVFSVLCPDQSVAALKEVDLSSADESTLEGYQNEITLLQSLQGNSYIIKMLGWENNQERQMLYIVMECGDADLNTVLKNRKKAGKKLDENYLRLYWQQMLEATQTIHEAQVVHADLKPANFLFVKGVLKLIDFGIAREVQDDQTSVIRDSAVGTLNYMAPEAITNQAPVTNSSKHNQIVKIAPSTDVWSLGCILYSMTFGKTPFQHLNPIQKLQAIVSPSYKIDFPKYHNPALTAVLKRCLQRDAKKRPSISELLSHKFLNPKTAATPKKTPKRAAPAGLTQEQLHAILSQLPQGMVAASPGALSRTIFGQMGGVMVEGAAAPPAPPPPKFLMEAFSEVALKPARRKTAPAPAPAQSNRPSLQQLDNNMLANRRQALKPAKLDSPRAKQPESTGMEAVFKNALDSRFKNANGETEGDTTSYTADWLTAQ